jgi:hypothetical protein
MLPALFFVLSLSTVARGEAVSSWADHALMGRCFASPQGFIESAFGAAGAEDENIKSSPANPLKDGSVWVIDHTPGTNSQWYLLQPGEGKQLCLTLFVPAAAQVTLSQSAKALAAKAKTQASPGFPAKQVDFKRKQGETRFSPVACQEIDYTKSKAGTRRKVDCASVFD